MPFINVPYKRTFGAPDQGQRARPPSQLSDMTGLGMFHVIVLKMFLKLFLNTCAQDKDHDIFNPGSCSKGLSLPRS
jgi:hypothetical protein